MAPPSAPKKRKVCLPENEELAGKLLEKHRSLMAEQPGGLSEHQAQALSAAYRGVCLANLPFRTPSDLSRIKGVGDWFVRVMEDSFPESNTPAGTGKKRKPKKPYAPQIGSAAYAIVITLYRELMRGKDFMMKQELIDAAEASGLSRQGIGPNNYKSKQVKSCKDRYTGWSCMKTLMSNKLVTKWSNPAKCGALPPRRSRWVLRKKGGALVFGSGVSRRWRSGGGSKPMLLQRQDSGACVRWVLRRLNKVVRAGCFGARYELTEKGKETACSFHARSVLDDNAGPSNYHSEEDFSAADSDEQYERSIPLLGSENFAERRGVQKSKAGSSSSFGKGPATNSVLPSRGVFGEQLGCAGNSLLAMPPRHSKENFLDTYEVVLILDNRETLGLRNRRNFVHNIHSQFHVTVEVKHLPVGDALWIARSRGLDTDYVLDFIVERKNVNDLVDSIRDNRYKDQKLRLKKYGLRKLIYLVEGDPNTVDAPESVKTACFTTAILEGFDVQKTSGYADTERKYGHLTRSIIDYYSTNFSAGADSSRVCVTYDEFVKRCSDHKRVTVSDVFALQLMQVPQVTEEVALAVTRLYPTVFSLAHAYSMLGDDRCAQEEMLMNKIHLVKAGASKAIFKFIWAED